MVEHRKFVVEETTTGVFKLSELVTEGETESNVKVPVQRE